MVYMAHYDPDPEGGFVITLPDFGWGVSHGDDEQECQEMATALLETVIEEHIRDGQPIPRPKARRGANYRPVRLPMRKSLKAELYQAFLDSGLRKVDLARRIDIPQTTVDRLFNLRYKTRIEQLEAALVAYGKRVDITVRAI